jgi:hypothetical protein
MNCRHFPPLLAALAFFSVSQFSAAAQDSLDSLEIAVEAGVVQVSGVVVTGDSLAPVAFATVYRVRDQRGTVTNQYGFFSMPARRGDTLRFTRVGLEAAEWVVEDLGAQAYPDRLSVVQTMGRDTVAVGTAEVHPWPARDKFKHEFLALRLNPDAIERGRRNLDPNAIFDRMSEMGTSAQENYQIAMNEKARMTGYQGGYVPVSVLSPLAWAKFLRALRNGDFSRD